jgi:hypothetical protein
MPALRDEVGQVPIGLSLNERVLGSISYVLLRRIIALNDR